VAEGSREPHGEWLQPDFDGYPDGKSKPWDGGTHFLINRLLVSVARGQPTQLETLKGTASVLALIQGVNSHIDGSELLGCIRIETPALTGPPPYRGVVRGADGQPGHDGLPKVLITAMARWRTTSSKPTVLHDYGLNELIDRGGQDIVDVMAQDVITDRGSGGVLFETGFPNIDNRSLRMPDGAAVEDVMGPPAR
jgi:hypothetical protein